MICTNFIFDNESLSDYGMIVCTFGDNNETSWSGGDITFNIQKAPSSDVQTFYTSSAETPLSCTFDICKNPCLMNKDGIEYIAVILGAERTQNWLSGRFIDCKTLFNYAFENYTTYTINEENSVLKQVKVSNASSFNNNLNIVVKDDI